MTNIIRLDQAALDRLELDDLASGGALTALHSQQWHIASRRLAAAEKRVLDIALTDDSFRVHTLFEQSHGGGGYDRVIVRWEPSTEVLGAYEMLRCWRRFAQAPSFSRMGRAA